MNRAALRLTSAFAVLVTARPSAWRGALWSTGDGEAVSSRILLSLVLATLVFAPLRAEEPSQRRQLELFEKKIRPVLVEHCYSCHSAEAASAGKLKGGLALDTRAGLLQGGDSGSALAPGKPAESLLLSALHYEGYEMPPAGQLPEAVIADFEKWIAGGAADPRLGHRRVQFRPAHPTRIAARGF